MVQTATTEATSFRTRLTAWLELQWVKNVILAVIVFSSISLGLATSDRLAASFGSWSRFIDQAVLTIFAIEVPAKLYAYMLPFIIITAFFVLNLCIGLVVNTMQAAVEEGAGAEIENLRDLVRDEIDKVAQEVSMLREEIMLQRSGLAQARGGGG